MSSGIPVGTGLRERSPAELLQDVHARVARINEAMSNGDLELAALIASDLEDDLRKQLDRVGGGS